MAIRGQITRLPFSTGNTDLPILINYDYSDILADILAWPTLRAFFDFSDLSTMTESGGEVVTITDKKAGYVATAEVGERGVYTLTGMNGQPGLTLDGTKKYAVPSLMSASDTKVTWASCFMSTAGDNTSRMILGDADNQTHNLYAGGDIVRMFNGAVDLSVPTLRNRPVNAIWTMAYLTDVVNIFADGLTAAGTSNLAVMQGDANIGAWNDAQTGNRFIGHLGYLAVFTEDASANATLRNLLDEYALRRWRMQ